MSGVLGVIDPRHHWGVDALAGRMATSLKHRDWCVAEWHTDQEFNLALGRTGIGIFNRGQQPVWNADRSVAVVMAGEIYVSPDREPKHERGQADEQSVLFGYEQLGANFPQFFEGAYVCAILDRPRRRLLIVNDHFGLYPTFYAQVGDRLVFAPEVKAILQAAGVRRTLRDDSVAEYVRFQHLLGFKTFFDDIHLLPPASVLTCDVTTGAYRIERYWTLGEAAQLPATVTFEEAVTEGARLFRAAVARQARGSKRIGVYLSGGLDGRSILGLVPDDAQPVHTFTFGQPGCRDEYYARQIASVAHARHHYYPYDNGRWITDWVDWHLTLTEGFHPWIHMHGINVSADARQYIDVNLSGLGDLLWTQPNFTPHTLFEPPDDIAFEASLFELYSQRYTWPGLSYADERYLYTEAYYHRINGLAFESFMQEMGPYRGLPYPQRLAAFNQVNHFLRYLMHAALFARPDIEVRFPYFDLALFSFCHHLPFELGAERRMQKAIILREMPALARIPTADDELPLTGGRRAQRLSRLTQTVQRGLHRFIPPIFAPRSTLYADYENWLRTDLRAWAEGILFDKRTLGRGIFRAEALRSLLDRHLSGQEPLTLGKIAHLITFEMMLRQLVDSTPD